MLRGLTRAIRIASRVVVLFALLCSPVLAQNSPESPKILIFPLFIQSPNIPDQLITFSDHADQTLRSSLKGLGDNYSVLDQEATKELLVDEAAPANEDDVRKLASLSGCQVVIYVFLKHKDERYEWKAVMWDLVEDRVMVSSDYTVNHVQSLSSLLGQFANQVLARLHGSPKLQFYRAGTPGSIGKRMRKPITTLASIPRQTGPWRSTGIRAAITALDIGDLDGDENNETVLLDKSHIIISRFSKDGLKPLSRFTQPGAEYLSAQVEDIDGNGVAELIVCYRNQRGLESAVIRYSKRNFRVVGRFPNMILRSIKDANAPSRRILVGQRTDVEDMFSGEMVLFDAGEGLPKPKGKIMLPPGTLLTSYVSGRLGRSSSFLRVILNQDQRLMVFDKDNRLLASLSDRLYGVERQVRMERKGESVTVIFPGRLLLADTKADGENELLVVKSTGGGSFVQGLTWDGKRLAENWKTVKSAGLISDFRIRDFKNHGKRSLVLILVKAAPFPWPLLRLSLPGPESVVFAYDLGP